ncbi:hypothetical protein Taro_011733 [Colocasia esculenta]|uniref:Uncharacterized protein n=1 Tax=Colocasia esculenta TaxID=4460 RepID=A0A843UAV4_COLES|nr:hypothetical protein [Colocasia esculenta]
MATRFPCKHSKLTPKGQTCRPSTQVRWLTQPPTRFMLTPLVGHETDQVKHLRHVYVDSQEVVVDSYCPPRTNLWGLNTVCRQIRVGCRQMKTICR